MTMEEKLTKLRAQMKVDGLDAYVISNTWTVFFVNKG